MHGHVAPRDRRQPLQTGTSNATSHKETKCVLCSQHLIGWLPVRGCFGFEQPIRSISFAPQMQRTGSGTGSEYDSLGESN